MGVDTPKPLLPLADEAPILVWSLRAFLNVAAVEALVVVVPESQQPQFAAVSEHLPQEQQSKIHFVNGGACRMESVGNGLKQAAALVTGKPAYVLIHDGARPFISEAVIEATIAAVQEKQAVTVAVPQIDSLKVVDQEGLVVKSPDRSSFVSVQTPQAFSLPLIEKAHAEGDATATDDAVLVEAIHRVHVVPGEYQNFKVTTPADYDYACYLSSKMTGISKPS